MSARAWRRRGPGEFNNKPRAACPDRACREHGCPEHPAHQGGDHTYEQHHTPRDHVGAGPCRCDVYTGQATAGQERQR